MIQSRKTKDKITGYGEVTEAVLLTIAGGAGVALLGYLSGGRGIKPMVESLARFSREQIKDALGRMRTRKLIRYEPEDEIAPLVLTKYGFKRATYYEIKQKRRDQNPPWDHFWRLYIFDIEERKLVRRSFQRQLCTIGCYRLQDSVYVHPHDLNESVVGLAKLYRVEHDVVSLIAPSLGPFEKTVRNYFSRKEMM